MRIHRVLRLCLILPLAAREPLAQRIVHTDPVEVPAFEGGPRRRRPIGLHGPVRRPQPRHQPVLSASRRHPAEERDRRALPQSMRGDVRHLRRRGAVHHRRPHSRAERTRRRAVPHGPLPRHLQRHRQAGAMDEHQRLRDEGHVRRLQSGRSRAWTCRSIRSRCS